MSTPSTTVPIPHRHRHALDPQRTTAALTRTRGTILAGVLLIAGAFGGFGSWAALAPLKSAAVAGGQVVVETQRKTIQHLEGGIIRELVVKDGDRVSRGDVLLTLEDATTRANYLITLKRMRALAAEGARLQAERDGAETVSFEHPLLTDHADPEVEEAIEVQRRQFESRRGSLSTQIQIRVEQIDQLGSLLEGTRSQLDSLKEQHRLLSSEIKDLQPLVEKKLAARPDMLRMQREQQYLLGSIGDAEARIARVQKATNETRGEIASLKAERLKEVDAEAGRVRNEYLGLEEQSRARQDALTRTAITSPVDGIVHALRFKTTGGVIRAGEPIMDIVPGQDELIVEAFVRPGDIDVVHAGLKAQVRFSAFNMRTTPTAVGEVTHVSADLFDDERTKATFYKAKIQISRSELDRLGGLALHQGMPADVLIETGERTALEAVLVPLGNWSSRAFREQEY